jgi:glycogen operon protein
MIHVVINAYWEALAFELPPLPEGARWRRWIDTSLASPEDISEVEEAPPIACSTYLVQAHSIAYLFAQAAS